MTDINGGADVPKKPMFDISKLHPEIEYDGETYQSRLSSRQVKKALSHEIEHNPKLSSQDFARLLLSKSIYLKDFDQLIDDAKAEELAISPAFLEKVIATHPEFYSKFVEDNEDTEKRLAKPFLEREENEPASDYLFRAYRNYLDRQVQQTRDFAEEVRRQFAGLSSSLSTSGFDSLLASTTASRQIDDIIKGSIGRDRISNIINGSGAGRTAEAVKRANDGILGRGIDAESFRQVRRYDFPPLPPNPIHETNATLAEIASSIDEMRDLFAQQAVMQSSLNKVATEILNIFAIGAKSAEVSSKRAIRIALAAIAVSILPFIYSVMFENTDQAILKKQAELIEVMKDAKQKDRNDARNSAMADQERHKELTNALKKLEPKLPLSIPKAN